jgi:flagellar basal body-associated protein FliL
MPPEEEAAPEQTEKKKRSGAIKELVTVGIIAAVFCAAGLTVTRIFISPRLQGSGEFGVNEEPRSEPVENDKPAGAPIFYDPIELIVNIEDKAINMDRFLIVEISLQMETERLRGEIAAIEPQIRDLFIGVLRSKTYEELKGASGQNRLKRELVEKANTLLNSGRVLDASFTKFQIQ